MEAPSMHINLDTKVQEMPSYEIQFWPISSPSLRRKLTVKFFLLSNFSGYIWDFNINLNGYINLLKIKSLSEYI